MIKSTKAIHITTMAHGGDAIGRYQGKVVFVPYAVPGEEVLVELIEERKNFSRARLVKVLTPAPARVEPPCKHFGECGGCQWQHIAYAAQLEYKREIVQGQLAHLGNIHDAVVHSVIGMEEPWNYRNHAQFHLTTAGELGFQIARSDDTVPIEECHVLHPFLEEILTTLDLELPELRGLSLRAGVNTGERMVIFEMEEGGAPQLEIDVPLSCVLMLPDGSTKILIGSDHYHEMLAGREYRVSAGSFFQVNTAQTEKMLESVTAYLAPQGNETLLDLYCGVGTLGLSLAERVGQVIGIEENSSAIADAVINSENSDNVMLIEGVAEEAVTALGMEIELPDAPLLAVLDPPRAGCKPEVLDALAKLAPKRVVYVSCDSATLARDTRGLLERGYELREVQPIDMFPQTHHVETVSLLVR